MAEGDGIESAWINGASHDRCIFTQRQEGGKEEFIFAGVKEELGISMGFDEAWAGGEVGVD
jgi:hypothetical protein